MSDEEQIGKTGEEEKLSLKETFRILFRASKGFWLVNVVNFGDGIAYFGVLTLLTLFLDRDVGFSDQMTGISVSVFTGLVTLFMLGGGFISDKLGVRRTLTLTVAMIGFGRVLLVLAPVGFFGLSPKVSSWIALIIMAIGEGVIQPALYAGVKEYTDPRTATIGYSLLYSIMNLGIVAENFVSPFVRGKFGITGVYWMCIFITGLMLISQTTFFTKRVEETDRVTIDAPKEKGPKLTIKQKLKELPFLDPRFLFFIFVLLPVRTLFAHQWLTLPHYVMRAFPEAVGARYEWFQGLNPFIIVIFVPLIAAMTREVKVLTMMIIGTTLSAAVTFILVPGPHLSTLILYVVLFSLGEAVWSSRFLEYVADIAPAGKVGAYMGIAGVPWFLAKFVTGFYSGFMLERFCPENGVLDTGTMWLVYGIIACISPIGLIAARKWIAKGVPEKAK
ncbi:MFS transporter [bacterium]|nr:MFS transporter [bacterium]